MTKDTAAVGRWVSGSVGHQGYNACFHQNSPRIKAPQNGLGWCLLAVTVIISPESCEKHGDKVKKKKVQPRDAECKDPQPNEGRQPSGPPLFRVDKKDNDSSILLCLSHVGHKKHENKSINVCKTTVNCYKILEDFF